MRARFAVAAATVASGLCLAMQSQGAAYIKFDGVDGEAQDKEHGAWSDLGSFSQPIHKPGSGTGATRRRGDVILEDITCAKELDKASPKIAESVCEGRVFPEVTIHLTRSYQGREVVYYVVELKNVLVTSHAVGGMVAGDLRPVEEFALNFEEVTVTYVAWDDSEEPGTPPPEVSYTCSKERGGRR